MISRRILPWYTAVSFAAMTSMCQFIANAVSGLSSRKQRWAKAAKSSRSCAFSSRGVSNWPPMELVMSWEPGIAHPVIPAQAHCCPGFWNMLVSPESEVSLWVCRPQVGWFGRWSFALTEAECNEQAEFDVCEQQRGAVFVSAGRGVMQDAQQHKSDQRDINLGAHGVLVAAEKAADLEVLLEPFEQQLDVPALFVELCDLDGGPLQVVGEQIEGLVVIGAGDHDLAQADIVERVERSAAAGLAVTDLDQAVGQDVLASSRVLGDQTAMRVVLASGDKGGAGSQDLGPPAVVGIALVEDISGARLDGHGAAGDHVVDLGRSHIEPYRPVLPRIIDQMQFQAARARIGLGPGKTIALERDRRCVEQPDQCLALLAQRSGRDRDQGRRNVAEHCRRPLGIGVGQRRTARLTQIEMVK